MSKINLTENASAPSTPSAGLLSVYAKTDSRLYHKNDAGVETMLAASGIGSAENIVYLATAANGGDDGTGTRGDPTKPFETFKAALEACTDGDILMIGTGTFTMSVAGDVPTWPVACDNLTIIGSGNDPLGHGGTKIINSVNNGSHIFDPNNTCEHLEIRNLFASVSAGTGRALFCDGTGSAGAFLGGALGAGSLVLDDCTFGGATTAITLRFVGLAIIDKVTTTLGGSDIIEVDTSNLYLATRCTGSVVNFDYDSTDPDAPAVGLIDSTFKLCEFSDFNASGHLKVNFYYCNIENLQGGTLSAAGGNAPRLTCYSCQIDTVDFHTAGKEYPDTASSKNCDFYQCRITTSLKLKVAGAAANFLTAAAKGCVLPESVGTVEAGAGVNLYVKGSMYSRNAASCTLATSGTGAIDPDYLLINHTTDGGSPDTASFGFTAQSAPSVVQAQATAAGMDAIVTAKSTTGVTVAYTAGGQIDLHVTWA